MARTSRRSFLKRGPAALVPALAVAAPAPKSVRVTESVPVIEEADICVLGGSCTGVFAAVRAARLGARVALVEKQGHFGGVAPIVCTWHSFFDTEFKRTIIGGLTRETVDKMRKTGAAEAIANNPSQGHVFRPGGLKVALDELVLAAGVKPWLHTLFSMPLVEEGRLAGVIVDGKSGRGAIRAKLFIDATGDGDLGARLGLAQYSYDSLLPPTTAAFLANWPGPDGIGLGSLIREHGSEFQVQEGFVWGSLMPGSNVYMLAGTRVNGVNCADSRDLTKAEIEGRRQVRAIMDLIGKYQAGSKVVLHDFPASIGIRDTRHFRCKYQLTGDDVLRGRRFDDAIANGSYRVDIHHQDKPGITLQYLNGSEVYSRPGMPSRKSRWREESATNPTFYQIPLRSLIPTRHENLMLAGRMLDADKTAFSAARVMVNMNQTGEAAGVAAYLALTGRKPIADVNPGAVRKLLSDGGSVII
jgi:hypothetical protein